MLKRYLILLIFFASIYVPGFSYSLDLENGTRDLATQIVNGMAEKNKQKIAVSEFIDLNGDVTNFGKFLSEELITQLFLSKKFDVIERQLLNKILNEHKINLSGVIDDKTAKKVGKVLGVDSICTGTVSDLGKSLKVNARLISTETGAVFAVASTEIAKNETVTGLTGTSRNTLSNSSSKPAPPTTKPKDIQFPPGTVFFFEDFLTTPDGHLPSGWTGGSNLIVGQVGRNRALYFSSNGFFEETVVTNKVQFPENFRLELVLSIDNATQGFFSVDIGNISIGNESCRMVFNGDKLGIDDCQIGMFSSIIIEKVSNVVTVFVNGKKNHIKRLERIDKIENMRIRLKTRKRNDEALLHKVVATSL